MTAESISTMLTFHRFVSVPYIYNWTLKQAKSLLEYSRFVCNWSAHTQWLK
ncbi:hypothetical protein [Methylomonas methanica]|uniref:hypothetical protein n=1 Tax=Methylomonas methanica TaxID=421 RepID=UPI0012F63B41|nr:hypothetical protein [Methylomonas methanica]